MTKEFQKELLEKVKPGVKASDLRKLKKSKSTGDLPNTPKSQPLQHSKSQLEIPTAQQPSSEEQITQLKEQVKFHAETAQNYLTSLQKSQAKITELEEKLKNNNSTELDNSLQIRHKNLKDWFQQYQKNKQLEQELASNIDEASEELTNQDNLIANLRSEVSKLKNDKESLQKDLKLAQKLAELRKVPYPEYESNWDYLKYPLYSLVLVLFTLWLTNHLRKENYVN